MRILGGAGECPACGCKEDFPCGPKPTLREEMLEAVRNAERAAHAYAASCDLGEERVWAFTVFERIRNSTRR